MVVGHINYAGAAGALGRLPDSQPGELVTISSGSASIRYRIVEVRTYPKTSGLPAALFDARGRAELVLITCGGPFDPASGNYEDNIVAIALPI